MIAEALQNPAVQEKGDRMLDHTKLNDLRGREFSRGFRGYSAGEVDEFIEELLSGAAQLIDLVSLLTQQLKGLEQDKDEVRRREEQLSATLVLAQTTAEEWKKVAKKDAENLLQDAQRAAEEILKRAKSDSDEMLRQAQGRMRDLEESRSRLGHDISLKIARLKGELGSMKESMDRWEEEASEIGDHSGGKT